MKKPTNPLEARAILEELARRTQRAKVETLERSERTPPYVRDLFQHQKNLISDDAKSKTAVCSRRSGKSHAAAAYACAEAETYVGCQVLYIALTRSAAKRIFWPKLKWLDRQYKLGMNFNEADLIATTRNGSEIILAGANNSSEIEKFRGSAFRLAIIDEAGSFQPYITELIEDVLEPTLIDYDGTLLLIGTPNARCAGYFFDATTDGIKGYSKHAWTILDNPHIPHAKDWLAQRMEKRGWGEDHPTYQREWLGRWVRDLNSLVYRIGNKNLQLGDWEPEMYCIGVDLGYEDSTAFAVWGWTERGKKIRLVDTFKKNHLLPHQVKDHLVRFIDRYHPVNIRVDTGGLGKAIVEEMVQRYSLPLQPAEKTKKHDFIEMMNSDFESGVLEIDPRLTDYIEEAKILQWDEERKKEDPAFENHVCDAALYGWREAKHWCYSPPERRVTPFDDDWDERYWEREAEKLNQRQEEENEWREFL